jgi:hypothetical protein
MLTNTNLESMKIISSLLSKSKMFTLTSHKKSLDAQFLSMYYGGNTAMTGIMTMKIFTGILEDLMNLMEMTQLYSIHIQNPKMAM